MKAQVCVCVNTVEQGRVSMHKLCDKVKDLLFCLEKNKNL